MKIDSRLHSVQQPLPALLEQPHARDDPAEVGGAALHAVVHQHRDREGELLCCSGGGAVWGEERRTGGARRRQSVRVVWLYRPPHDQSPFLCIHRARRQARCDSAEGKHKGGEASNKNKIRAGFSSSIRDTTRRPKDGIRCLRRGRGAVRHEHVPDRDPRNHAHEHGGCQRRRRAQERRALRWEERE